MGTESSSPGKAERTDMSQIFEHAWLITMDPQNDRIRDGALVVTDGKISWVGSAADIPEIYNDAERVDCHGKVIYPGFINAHSHAALSVLRGVGDDIGMAPAYSRDVPQGVFMSEEDIYTFSLLGGLETLKFGCTMIVDNYIHERFAAKAFDELGMRAVVSERIHDADLFGIPAGNYTFDMNTGMDLLQKNLDLIEHWKGHDRISGCIGPHAPDTCSDDFLREVRKAADETNQRVVIHLAQGMREVNQIKARSGLSPVEFVNSFGLLDERTIAGHCIYVSEKDRQLIKDSHVHVAHMSGSNSKGGMTAPISDYKDAGVNICLGTDNMSGDMIMVMRLALVTSRMRTQSNSLYAADVLVMATMGGARALGMENSIGSLEVGKQADFITMDYDQIHLVPLVDPVMNLVHNGLSSDIRDVYVGGRKVIENGRSMLIDEKALLKEAQERCLLLWKKVRGE